MNKIKQQQPKTKILNEEEAKQLALSKFHSNDEICCFVGNLDEVFEHAFRKHKIRGHMNNTRLDGSVFTDDINEGQWIVREEVLTKDNGAFWYVCLETHTHDWYLKKEPEKYGGQKAYCNICKDETWYSQYEFGIDIKGE